MNAPEVYYLTSPSGLKIEVSKPVFSVFEHMLLEKATGRIEIDCRNGGVSGVRATQVFK